jgi:hypothetical protein
VDRLRAARGRRCAAQGRQSGGGASGKETEEAVARGGRRGLVWDLQKVQGPHCNVLVTF